jgi:hypothetical protein
VRPEKQLHIIAGLSALYIRNKTNKNIIIYYDVIIINSINKNNKIPKLIDEIVQELKIYKNQSRVKFLLFSFLFK